MKDRYLKAVGQYEGMGQRNEELKQRIHDTVTEANLLEESLSNLFSFNEWLNAMTRVKLESITNAALKTIFPDKEMSFRVVSNKTKRGVFYDLFIETNGVTTELLEAKGGGVLDVIQLCLRITYLTRMKGQLRQTLILDEPLKNLDVERIGYAAQWLKHISESLGTQFVVITHIPMLTMTLENTGVIEVRLVDGESRIL